MLTKTCIYCGKVFTTHENRRRFCSLPCSRKSPDTEKKVKDFISYLKTHGPINSHAHEFISKRYKIKHSKDIDSFLTLCTPYGVYDDNNQVGIVGMEAKR